MSPILPQFGSQVVQLPMVYVAKPMLSDAIPIDHKITRHASPQCLQLDEDATPGTAARPCGAADCHWGPNSNRKSLTFGTSTTSHHFRGCKAYATQEKNCKWKVRALGGFGLCCFSFCHLNEFYRLKARPYFRVGAKEPLSVLLLSTS